MQAFLVSTGVVALAEFGDKTQLLAFILAARFRKPVPIVTAILIATLANHAFAGAVGAWLSALASPAVLRWTIGVSFIAMAVWTLIPDRLERPGDAQRGVMGAFGTTLVAFFLAEMGDKTQVATVALAARYADLWTVVSGTTLGMMIANIPAVYLGERLSGRAPVKVLRAGASALLLLLGMATILGAGKGAGL